ncbi:MAG TPA: excinuclease ABC subunit UvrC [Campylobacterales bacterium]|nr:excinuclease ABC subunit UvrC [Campylobacterales bacterium]
MTLEEKIKELPTQPGIYQYFDENDKLLYIGKAKSLKNRVKNYFRFTPDFQASNTLSARIAKMIFETVRLEYIVVDSEHDALILENSLIKQLRPKYNILLRDDKTYPYIYIDLKEDFPRFEITRKVVKGTKIKYFGPFSHGAREIYDSLYEIFPLIQKKSCLKGGKLCLFYQIKRCLGPCEGKVTVPEYKKIVADAMSLLYNKKALISKLEEKMFDYAQRELFEEATTLRDRITKIESSQRISNIDLAKLEDYDIFSISQENKVACGMRLFIREGKVVSSSHTLFKSDTGFDKDELYKRLLLEYYQEGIPLVKNILVLEDFSEKETLQALLRERFSKSIMIAIPQKGEKKRLVDLALLNAKEILRIGEKQDTRLLEELKTLLNLEKTPYVIEGYDNSHLQGEATVGAMIKWENRFLKKEYRHYNLSARDEYAQMKEMMQRRVESFHKNPPPDLMVIDGGETLLKLAIKIVKLSGANVDVVAIAKEKRDNKAQRARGKANDILCTSEGVLKLSHTDKRLQFIQTIRDESHRFVIAYHRKQKLKSDKQVALLEKKGVGAATIAKLLQYFETFSNIEKASFEELEGVVGTKIALNIQNI